MAWGDKIDQFNIKVTSGENLVVSIDLESREYNGGAEYTDCFRS